MKLNTNKLLKTTYGFKYWKTDRHQTWIWLKILKLNTKYTKNVVGHNDSETTIMLSHKVKNRIISINLKWFEILQGDAAIIISRLSKKVQQICHIKKLEDKVQLYVVLHAKTTNGDDHISVLGENSICKIRHSWGDLRSKHQFVLFIYGRNNTRLTGLVWFLL